MSDLKEPARVLVGLPVFNGEQHVSLAIESVLNQTLANLRLVISDNASTDRTEGICRAYCKADERVEYFRQASNLGLVPNFNFVYQPAGEPYFKWVGHDDLIEPAFLERCVELLEADPSLAVAQTLSFEIDDEGNKIRTYDDDFRLDSARPRDRLWRLLWATHLTELWGVLRTEQLGKIRKMGSYVGSDRNFTAELLLLGRVGYAEEHLMGLRSRADSYTGGGVQGKRSRILWHDSNARVSIVPDGLINLREYIQSILTLPLSPRERIACLRVVTEWGLRRGIEELTGRHNAYRAKVAAEYGRRPS